VRNRLREANAAFREQNRAFFDREVVREIRALLEHGIAQPLAGQPQVAIPLPPSNGTTSANGKGPLKVSITYCAECGYEPQTLGLAEALMKAFVNDLASIELIPWHDGAFDVVVGGDLVHSMYRDGGFPEHEAIINAVRQRMAAN
jgi:selenoprotein W-related protein